MKYLLITYVRKANEQIDEQMQVSNTLKDRDVQTCNVILNFETNSIEKAVINGNKVDTTWEQIVEYYSKIYPSIVGRLIEENMPPQ